MLFTQIMSTIYVLIDDFYRLYRHSTIMYRYYSRAAKLGVEMRKPNMLLHNTAYALVYSLKLNDLVNWHNQSSNKSVENKIVIIL